MKDKREQLILVIEADDYTREAVAEVLEYEGYRLVTAADGSSGLAEARRLRPDLIVSDVSLPGLNGYEVLDALRTDLETASIPFVFLVLRRGDAPAFRSGVGDYLTTPLDIGDLIAIVESRLQGQ